MSPLTAGMLGGRGTWPNDPFSLGVAGWSLINDYGWDDVTCRRLFRLHHRRHPARVGSFFPYVSRFVMQQTKQQLQARLDALHNKLMALQQKEKDVQAMIDATQKQHDAAA